MAIGARRIAEFHKLMSDREEDHRKWLGELERSAAEGAEFRLATDPHKCAFGPWYRPECTWTAALLRRLERPHTEIHAIAAMSGELLRAGKKEQAFQLIEQKRSGERRF